MLSAVIMEIADKKHHHWGFTINNPTEGDVAKMLSAFERATNYFAQDEIGPVNKVPHIQGFISFKSQRYRLAMSKDFPRAFLKPCYKCVLANMRYCSKNDTRAPNGRRWQFNLSDVRYMSEKDRVFTHLESLRIKVNQALLDKEILDLLCRGLIPADWYFTKKEEGRQD